MADFNPNIAVITSLLLIFIVWYTIKVLTANSKQQLIYIHEGIITKVISDSKSCISGINTLLSYSPSVVGLDCEWKSLAKNVNNTNTISLLQISHENVILLIRLHLISPFPMELISFLNNIKILKCGVGIYGDKKKLFKDYNICMCGCIDLNNIFSNNNEYLSLQKLCKLILKKEMKYKNSNIDHSKWETKKLSKQQINYAANDAIVGYQLFNKIIENQYSKQINEGQSYLEICFGKIDRCSSKIKNKNTQNNLIKNGIVIKQRNKTNKSQIRSRQLTYKRYGYAAKILDENGDILTLCSANLKRYLLKSSKAKTINNVDKYFPDKSKKVNGHNQYVIQLLHKPETVDIYNKNIKDYVRSINVKELECYICGRYKNLNRTFIVPKHYPKFINCAKKIHYAVPICLDQCQQRVFKWKCLFEEDLINKYKLNENTNKSQHALKNKLKLYALTLRKRKKRFEISVEMQNEWIQQILSYFNVSDRQNITIKECHVNKEINIDWYIMNDFNYCIVREYLNILLLDANKVKEYKIKESVIELYEMFKGKEIEFIEIWRNNFMDTFKPKCHNQKFETLQVFCTDFKWQS